MTTKDMEKVFPLTYTNAEEFANRYGYSRQGMHNLLSGKCTDRQRASDALIKMINDLISEKRAEMEILEEEFARREKILMEIFKMYGWEIGYESGEIADTTGS